MIGFLVAVVAGVFLLLKNAVELSEIREFDERIAQRKEEQRSLSDSYMTDKDLDEEVKRFVKQNYSKLVEEFDSDLIYIYGKNYVYDNMHKGTKNKWKYGIEECLYHLVLAKYYRKLANWFGSYNTGIEGQVYSSLKMFKKINDYIKSEKCELTMVPRLDSDNVCLWGPQGAVFKPAIYNVYSDKPESRSGHWLRYC